MMKRLSFIVALACLGLAVPVFADESTGNGNVPPSGLTPPSAPVPTGTTLTDGGSYYLYNVEGGQFLAEGNAHWGTEAVFSNEGALATLTSTSDDEGNDTGYLITFGSTVISSSNNTIDDDEYWKLFYDGYFMYVDGSVHSDATNFARRFFTFTEVDGSYTIQLLNEENDTDGDNHYLGYSESFTGSDYGHSDVYAVDPLLTSGDAVNWLLVSETDYATYQTALSNYNSTDRTFLSNALLDAIELELTTDDAVTEGMTVYETAGASQDEIDAATEALAKLIQENGTASGEIVTDAEGTQYKVVGANLIPNPDFRYGYVCWTTEVKNAVSGQSDTGNTLEAISRSYFQVNEDNDGGYYLTSTNGAGTPGDGTLVTEWEIDPNKTYYFSCSTFNANSIYSSLDVTTLTNSQGSHSEHTISTSSTEWTDFEYVFTPTDEGIEINEEDNVYALVRFAWTTANSSSFTNFQLVEVAPYVDDEYAIDDVITIGKAQYKVTSENLIKNGGFSDGVDNWTYGNTYSDAAAASNFGLSATGGFNGGAYMTTTADKGASDPTTASQAVEVTEGSTYVFIGYTSGKTPSKWRNVMYSGLFSLTKSGDTYSESTYPITTFEWGADVNSSTDEWTQTIHAFKATTDYVGVRMAWCPSASYDGLQLYEVEPVETVDDTEYSDGDEVVVDGKTYTISGDNLVQNGGFENGVSDWTAGGYSTAAEEENFTLTSTSGFNGKGYITTSGAGASSETTLMQAIEVESGKDYLFIGYTSGATPKSINYQYNALKVLTYDNDTYSEGDVIAQLSWGTAVASDPDNSDTNVQYYAFASGWTETDYVFTATTDYVGIHLGWNYDTKFDGFQLYEIERAYTYDDVLAAIDEIGDLPTVNVGTDAFQISATALATLQAVIDEATEMDQETSTSADYLAEIEKLEEAAATFEATPLNEPSDGQVFNIIMADETAYSTNDNWAGKTVRFAEGNSNAGGYTLNFAEDVNANLANQIFTFTPATSTAVTQNGYKISFVDANGTTQYLCLGTVYSGQPAQIRATSTESNAFVFQVIVTETENVWNIYNTTSSQYVGSANDNGFYTSSSHTALTLAEAPSEIEWKLQAEYGTLVLPFAPTSTETEGLTFWSTTAYGEEPTLALTSVDEPQAGVPYIVSGTEGTYTFAVTARSFDTEATAGWLTGVYETTTVEQNNYVLQNQNDVLAFYLVATDDIILNPNHCYLTVITDGTDNADAPAAVFFPSSGTATAIEGVEAETAGSEAIYDLQGRKVSQAQKGIYIKGGKKVVIK